MDRDTILRLQHLVANGRQREAYYIVAPLVKSDPSDIDAWLWLFELAPTTEGKRLALNSALSLDPHNPAALSALSKLTSESPQLTPSQIGVKPTDHSRQAESQSTPLYRLYEPPSPSSYALSSDKPTHPLLKLWSRLATPSHVLAVVIPLVAVSCCFVGAWLDTDPFYKPTPEKAFSYAAGYALDEMFARDPVNYWCGGAGETEPAASWYEINVREYPTDTYSVTGATKVIDRWCVYEISYFSTTVHYDRDHRSWQLDGEVYFSNKCVVVGHECTGQYWDWGWKPDMSWRRPP